MSVLQTMFSNIAEQHDVDLFSKNRRSTRVVLLSCCPINDGHTDYLLGLYATAFIEFVCTALVAHSVNMTFCCHHQGAVDKVLAAMQM